LFRFFLDTEDIRLRFVAIHFYDIIARYFQAPMHMLIVLSRRLGREVVRLSCSLRSVAALKNGERFVGLIAPGSLGIGGVTQRSQDAGKHLRFSETGDGPPSSGIE
jgi:hypothetical protein